MPPLCQNAGSNRGKQETFTELVVHNHVLGRSLGTHFNPKSDCQKEPNLISEMPENQGILLQYQNKEL
jgi:hypothetical protein